MEATIKRRVLKIRRKKRARKKISGTGDRPRLSVFRSARHIYAQVIDDTCGKTLLSASSFGKDSEVSGNVEGCKKIGETIAKLCAEKNIQSVVFDKNGNKYHGRVKSLADGAREAGLNF